MHIATAQVFGRNNLTRRGFHQRRAAQKDGALVFDNDGFITHGRHIGTARRTRPHHHGNLPQALSAQVGLVVEDAAKVVAVRKHVVLIRQVGTA